MLSSSGALDGTRTMLSSTPLCCQAVPLSYVCTCWELCSAGWELCSDHTPAYHAHDSSDYLRLHLLYVCMLGYLVSTNHSTVQAYSSVWLLYICSCWDILYLPVTQTVRAYPHYDIILRYLRIILIQITQFWDTLTIRFNSTWQFAD